MDLEIGIVLGLDCRFPRTRGDGPFRPPEGLLKTAVSPHTRGWTLPDTSDVHCPVGFPAHAGMDPGRTAEDDGARRFPRTRGDGPEAAIGRRALEKVSPHTRGWTSSIRWTSSGAPGFPAHAGMDLGVEEGEHGEQGFPRTRGDGPRSGSGWRTSVRVSPHTRGWTPEAAVGDRASGGFPAHGDGPRRSGSARLAVQVSPHTRGWTCPKGGPCGLA